MKRPKIVPQIGQPVRLKGREPAGILKFLADRGWAFVAWTTTTKGPRIVHIDELEVIA